MTTKIPALPEAAHPNLDSMLTRKFGKEVANYFAGSPLNRLGWLRDDHKFLSQALRHSTTSFLLCNQLQPLVQPNTEPGKGRLHYVSYEDVKPIVGDQLFTKTEEEDIKEFDSRRYVPQLIFLGIDDKFENGLSYQGRTFHSGKPYFALDVTPREHLKEACEKLIQAQKEKGYDFAKGRVMDIDAYEAAIYAEARQLLDWNSRNPFCAGCGHRTLSVHAGFKRSCPPRDAASNPPERPDCPTRHGVSNLCFPRTDPTVIMAVVNHRGDKILLGRSKRFPPNFYSTLAGFAEPAESIEEAVRREVYEEAGVLLGRVVIHSTQPWPYPANLMIGAIGQAVPEGETIDLGNDPELEDANWYDLDTVRKALRQSTDLGAPPPEGYKAGDIRVPPSTAIAHQLMTAVCDGFASSLESKI